MALWHSSPSRPTQFMGSVCAISTWPPILLPTSTFPFSGWLAWRWSRGPVEATYCEWQSFGQWSEGGRLAELSWAPARIMWARSRVWMPACYSSWWGPDYTDDGDVGQRCPTDDAIEQYGSEAPMWATWAILTLQIAVLKHVKTNKWN